MKFQKPYLKAKVRKLLKSKLGHWLHKIQDQEKLDGLKSQFLRFLKWSAHSQERGLHALTEALEMWSGVESEAYEALRNCACLLDEATCREFVKWLFSLIPHEGLGLMWNQLPALARLLGLGRYGPVFKEVFTQVLKGWSSQSAVNTVLLPINAASGRAKDVKTLKALVSRSSALAHPGVFAVNFQPDSGCQRTLDNAVVACRKLFAPWNSNMLVFLVHIFLNLPIWIPVLPLAAGVVVVMDIWQGGLGAIWAVIGVLACLFCLPSLLCFYWWFLLGRSSIYFKLEGVSDGQIIKDGSMGLSAAVALLLALSESRSLPFLPMPISYFVRCLRRELPTLGWSGEIALDGTVLKVEGIWHIDGTPGPKQEAFLDAEVSLLILPRANKQAGLPVRGLQICWISSLQRLVWFWLVRFQNPLFLGTNTVLIVCLIAFFWLWPYVFPQDATITGGFSRKGQLSFKNEVLLGDGFPVENLTINIAAERFHPPLTLEIEPLIGLVAVSPAEEFKHQVLQVPVQPSRTVSFIYQCIEQQQPLSGGLLVLRLRNYRNVVEEQVLLFLDIRY